MFLMRLKNFISTSLALLLTLVLLFFTQSLSLCRFWNIEGKRSFYLQSLSSQAVIKEKILPWELFSLKGESVTFPCEDREQTLAEILQRYDAKALFKEEGAGDSYSYYCFTKKWTDGVILNGQFVNLHIAFNGERCIVGAPMIFGGF